MLYQTHFKNEQFPYRDTVMNGSQSFSPHCHHEMEIIYIKKGELKIIYEQTLYTLTEGMIAIIPPYINHALPEPESYCERFIIETDLNLTVGEKYTNPKHKANYSKYLYKRHTLSSYWSPETYSKVKTLILSMHDEYLRQEIAWEFSIKTFMNLLLLVVIRSFPKRENNSENREAVQKLRLAIEYVALNYRSHVSLQECADLCGFHPTYFSKYFKKHMGITFQAYVKNTRIEHAKWLLTVSSHSITEIALSSGFSDMRVFNKLFKQETGMAASDYRKAVAADTDGAM